MPLGKDTFFGLGVAGGYKKNSGSHEATDTAESSSESAPKTLYDALGVRANASKDEIKAAFLKLAMKFHPDRHDKESAAVRAEASRRFKEAADAYGILSDDEMRSGYDNAVSRGETYRRPRHRWSAESWTEDEARRAQAAYARRAGEDVFLLRGAAVERWRILGVVSGDDGSPVLLKGPKGEILAIPVAKVVAMSEGVKALPADVDGSGVSVNLEKLTADSMERKVVETGAKPPATPVMVELEDDESEKPVAKKGVPLHLRYGAGDISDTAEDIISDDVDESLHAEKRDAGTWDKIFKHNLAHEEYRQRGIGKLRNQVLSTRNVFVGKGLSRADHEKATGAMLERLVQRSDEFLHNEGAHGERRTEFGKKDAEGVTKYSPEEEAVRVDLLELVKEYASNVEMSKEELQLRRDKIFASANALGGEAKGRGMLYADNLDKLAEQVRQAAAAVNGMENLDIDLEIVVGRMKLGARTEREKNFIDKTLEKLDQWSSRHPVAGGAIAIAFRNEIGIALGAAASMWGIGIMAGLKNTAAKALTFGGSAVVTGAYSAWKEKGRLNSERALHERQMALGGETKNDDSNKVEAELLARQGKLGWWQPMERYSLEKEIQALRSGREVQPRRAEMEKFALARESAKGLAESVRGFLSADSKELRGDVTIENATEVLANIEARIRISDREKIDLLKYTGVAEAEVERLNLDVARASLKAALRKAHEDAYGEKVKNKTVAGFQEYFDYIYKLSEVSLYGKETSKARVQQKKFAEWSNRVALKRGLSTMAIGAVVGTVAHDLWALGTGGDTTIGSAWHALMAYFNHAPLAAVGSPNMEMIGGGSFTTPPGTDLVPQADGSFVLESAADHHAIASGLHIDASGHLDAASEATLRGAGANIVEKDQWINSGATTSTKESTWEWLRHHAMQKIHRDHWMDNDTPMHFSEELKRWLGADHNELKLEWGGVTGDGVHPMGLDSDGQIVMTMGHMAKDGSFHSGLTDNAPAELVEGKIRVLLTMNDHAQNSVIEVLPDQHGQIHIDPTSDIGKTFFRIDHGKVIPLYHTAEVGVSKGFDAAGVNHFSILATAQGAGVHSGITSTDTAESVARHVTNIDLPGHEVPPVIVPWFVPIRGRQPMEPMKKGPRGEAGPFMPPVAPPPLPPGEFAGPEAGNQTPELEGGDSAIALYPYYPNATEGSEQALRADMSPRLKEDPNAPLNPRKEMEWYFEDMERRYPGYKKELDTLDAQNKDKMGDSVEACVALAAAGAGEHANIYRTLETYAVNRDRKGASVWAGKTAKFEILLYVNWPKGADANKTFSEIERFRKDHPKVALKVYSEEIKVGKPEVGWIKRKVFDLALRRNLRRSGDREILVIANDADTVYGSPEYLVDVLDDMKKRPDLDALVGRQDLDPEVYEKNPTFHVAMRFAQFIEAISRSKTGNIMTQGRNTILRGSSYAAIGGNRTKDFWADIEFGRLFSVARGGKRTVGYSNKDWVMVDPRREIDKFKSGELVAYTWSDFNDRKNVRGGGMAEHAQPENLDVRKLAEASESDEIVQQFNARIRDEIEAFMHIAQKTFYYHGSGQIGLEGEEYLRQTLDFLGIKADISPHPEWITVIPTDTSVLRRRLLEYRESNRKGAKLKNNPLGPFVPPVF